MDQYAIMPYNDYKSACNAIREKTGRADVIKSGDMATEINSITSKTSVGYTKYYIYSNDAEDNYLVCDLNNNCVIYYDYINKYNSNFTHYPNFLEYKNGALTVAINGNYANNLTVVDEKLYVNTSMPSVYHEIVVIE